MLYADEEEAFLPLLIPYMAYFAPRFDAIGPHIGLVRPHLKALLPHLPAIVKAEVERFAPYCIVSANADVLLWYLGWVLRLPFAHRLLQLPGMPRVSAFLARRLPKWPVRGLRGAYYECEWEECATGYRAPATPWADRRTGVDRRRRLIAAKRAARRSQSQGPLGA